jgi:hypothetical protein
MELRDIDKQLLIELFSLFNSCTTYRHVVEIRHDSIVLDSVEPITYLTAVSNIVAGLSPEGAKKLFYTLKSMVYLQWLREKKYGTTSFFYCIDKYINYVRVTSVQEAISLRQCETAGEQQMQDILLQTDVAPEVIIANHSITLFFGGNDYIEISWKRNPLCPA